MTTGDQQPVPERPADAIDLADGVWVRESDLRFSFSRSSGPGGQAVNKLNTRAELRVRIEQIVDGLRPLLKLPVEYMLATHGGPMGRAALERALS